MRLLTDRGLAFDDVAEGYDGPALSGDRAPDLLGSGAPRHAAEPAAPEGGRAAAAGDPQRRRRPDASGIVGFRGRRHAGVIDLDHEDGHDPRDFWEPLEARAERRGELLLDPGEFYILASKEAVEIPVDAGRRDDARSTPRWASSGSTTPASSIPASAPTRRTAPARKGVLEVRSHDTPFLLEDGQTVARLVYEPLTERPTRLYGEGGSHYQRQGLKLSKHFRPWPDA